jgi:hypothetical protein
MHLDLPADCCCSICSPISCCSQSRWILAGRELWFSFLASRQAGGGAGGPARPIVIAIVINNRHRTVITATFGGCLVFVARVLSSRSVPMTPQFPSGSRRVASEKAAPFRDHALKPRKPGAKQSDGDPGTPK